MRTHRRRTPIGVLPLLYLTAILCWPGACAVDRYGDWTESKPAEEDLVGVWQITEDSRRHLAGRGFCIAGQCRLVLKKGGVLQIVRMPGWWLRWLDNWETDCSGDHTVFAGTGTWEFIRSPYDEWQLYFQFTGRIGQGEPISAGINFAVRKQAPPYLLHTYIDDPDLNNAMILERISTVTACP